MNVIVNADGLKFEVSDADLGRFLANGWSVPAAPKQEKESKPTKKTTKKE